MKTPFNKLIADCLVGILVGSGGFILLFYTCCKQYWCVYSCASFLKYIIILGVKCWIHFFRDRERELHNFFCDSGTWFFFQSGSVFRFFFKQLRLLFFWEWLWLFFLSGSAPSAKGRLRLPSTVSIIDHHNYNWK